MMKSIVMCLSNFAVVLSVSAADITELDKVRVQQIVRAFNQKPEGLIEPLTAAAVKIKNGVGRADVNKKAKFSYYVQTEDSLKPDSKIYLIPMATSRFTPTYYQTDEWWDAHKDQKPMPRQPMDEVAAWLHEMKLTSNPDVLIIQGDSGVTERKPLNQFLLEHYLKAHARNGVVTLYRGAEREGELEYWKTGKRPASVRYWTPTANYAWRYARKNLNFVEELVQGRAPLFKFQVPVQDFKAMVERRWPRLTLGTELTKKAHDSFDSTGVFRDHLAGGADFLGEGTFGVEFEVRSNRAGADDMLKYYVGPITVQELAEDRIRVIRESTARLQRQRPQEADALEIKADRRVQQIQTEAELLHLIQTKGDQRQIKILANQITEPEMTAIDGFSLSGYISGFIRSAIANQRSELEKIKATNPVKPSAQKSCRAVLW